MAKIVVRCCECNCVVYILAHGSKKRKGKHSTICEDCLGKMDEDPAESNDDALQSLKEMFGMGI